MVLIHYYRLATVLTYTVLLNLCDFFYAVVNRKDVEVYSANIVSFTCFHSFFGNLAICFNGDLGERKLYPRELWCWKFSRYSNNYFGDTQNTLQNGIPTSFPEWAPRWCNILMWVFRKQTMLITLMFLFSSLLEHILLSNPAGAPRRHNTCG